MLPWDSRLAAHKSLLHHHLFSLEQWRCTTVRVGCFFFLFYTRRRTSSLQWCSAGYTRVFGVYPLICSHHCVYLLLNTLWCASFGSVCKPSGRIFLSYNGEGVSHPTLTGWYSLPSVVRLVTFRHEEDWWPNQRQSRASDSCEGLELG